MKQQIDCKFCGGFAFLLGVLGYLAHYRCQDCGLEFSRKIRKSQKQTRKENIK